MYIQTPEIVFSKEVGLPADTEKAAFTDQPQKERPVYRISNIRPISMPAVRIRDYGEDEWTHSLFETRLANMRNNRSTDRYSIPGDGSYSIHKDLFSQRLCRQEEQSVPDVPPQSTKSKSPPAQTDPTRPKKSLWRFLGLFLKKMFGHKKQYQFPPPRPWQRDALMQPPTTYIPPLPQDTQHGRMASRIRLTSFPEEDSGTA